MTEQIKKKVLVTGMAGFIGYHLGKTLAASGYEVTGIDNINDYYDVELKYARLEDLGIERTSIKKGVPVRGTDVTFVLLDLTDQVGLRNLFKDNKFAIVINLAAQAGVRYSLINPHSYVDSNITGFLNILECCREFPVEHLVFASSSSVYGLSEDIPFREDGDTDHPLAMYAASKKANEMMAHAYANLYGIPCTGLRFFTVYGPWGRPDMALFLFTSAMREGRPIEVFNNGDMSRDFTYIDDIVESVKRLIPLVPEADSKGFDPKDPVSSRSSAPYRIFNIGNNSPVALMDFVREIEACLGIRAEIDFKPMQPGDVRSTYADVQSLFDFINYKPQTPLSVGVKRFVDFYISRYG